MQDVDDDLIPLLDELPDVAAVPRPGSINEWPILVIDDDPEVHSATRFALTGVEILGRPLQLDYASSSAEAKKILHQRQDYAVILLDVVMETEDAGLQLVGFIRETLGMQEVRIILRTGQPGYAPELAVFTNYDINDYRTKAELSRTRLVTSLTAALRSFQQLRTIAEGRRGLEMIIRAAARLMQHQALSEFAEGVLIQVAAMLRLPPEGIVCAQRGSPIESDDSEGLYIVGAAGELAGYIGHPLNDLPDGSGAVSAIAQCMQARSNTFGKQSTVIYLSSGGRDGAVYMNTGFPLSDMDQQLIGVFGSNMSACFGNVRLLEDLNYTAYHDGLTHLANRTRFIMDLEEVATCDQPDICVVLLDIEHFADLNDGLGHDVGNALCQHFGKLACQYAAEQRRQFRRGDEIAGRAELAAAGAVITQPRRVQREFHITRETDPAAAVCDFGVDQGLQFPADGKGVCIRFRQGGFLGLKSHGGIIR